MTFQEYFGRPLPADACLPELRREFEAAKQEQSESLKAISSRFKHRTGISRIVKVCGFLGSFWLREITVSPCQVGNELKYKGFSKPLHSQVSHASTTDHGFGFGAPRQKRNDTVHRGSHTVHPMRFSPRMTLNLMVGRFTRTLGGS